MTEGWAIARQLLLAFEEAKSFSGVEASVTDAIQQIADRELCMEMLNRLTQNNFVHDAVVNKNGVFFGCNPCLTMAGHDLLETIRNKEILEKVIAFSGRGEQCTPGNVASYAKAHAEKASRERAPPEAACATERLRGSDAV